VIISLGVFNKGIKKALISKVRIKPPRRRIMTVMIPKLIPFNIMV
jgi:hypothetical protein